MGKRPKRKKKCEEGRGPMGVVLDRNCFGKSGGDQNFPMALIFVGKGKEKWPRKEGEPAEGMGCGGGGGNLNGALIQNCSQSGGDERRQR